MPKYNAEERHLQIVEQLLHARGFNHLRARKYGTAVIVESGPKDDAFKHIRLTRQTAQIWTVDMGDSRGRWESTPFRASLDELVAAVADTFPWTLQDVLG